MSNTETKTGHPALGLTLGILGMVFAVMLTLFTGVIGGGLAFALAVAAILVGVYTRNCGGGKGAGAIVTGIIALLLAVSLTFASVGIFTVLRDRARENPATPLVAKYCENPYMGFLGFFLSIPKDQGTAKELSDQLKILVDDTNKSK